MKAIGRLRLAGELVSEAEASCEIGEAACRVGVEKGREEKAIRDRRLHRGVPALRMR